MMPAARKLVWKVVDDEAFIVDLDSGDYFSLNAVGTQVWLLLQQQMPESAIAEAISAKYGVDVATAARDVAELTADLRDARVWSPE